MTFLTKSDVEQAILNWLNSLDCTIAAWRKEIDAQVRDYHLLEQRRRGLCGGSARVAAMRRPRRHAGEGIAARQRIHRPVAQNCMRVRRPYSGTEGRTTDACMTTLTCEPQSQWWGGLPSELRFTSANVWPSAIIHSWFIELLPDRTKAAPKHRKSITLPLKRSPPTGSATGWRLCLADSPSRGGSDRLVMGEACFRQAGSKSRNQDLTPQGGRDRAVT